jgi:hypothetical protein
MRKQLTDGQYDVDDTKKHLTKAKRQASMHNVDPFVNLDAVVDYASVTMVLMTVSVMQHWLKTMVTKWILC